MIDYPTTLPLPNYGSYSGAVIPGLIRTSTPTTKPNQRVSFNSPQTQISMTFSMNNDDYAVWRDWMLANGYDWFKMPAVTPLDPVLITSTRRVRLTSDIQVAKVGDNWLTATVAAECIPGDIPDLT